MSWQNQHRLALQTPTPSNILKYPQYESEPRTMIHLKLKFRLKCSNMYEKEHEENLLSALFVFISLDMLLSDKLGLSVLFRPGKMFPSFPADHTHTHTTDTHTDNNKCQNIKYQNSSYTYKFIHKQEAVLMRIMNETLQTFLNILYYSNL